MNFWEHANLIRLPEAEASGEWPRFGFGSAIGVVGAQRSGTTWLTQILGMYPSTVSLTEEKTFLHCFDKTIDPQSLPSEKTVIVQLTFLTACPRLFGAALESVSAVAVLRSPPEICWSMLYNWQSLDPVSRMVARVRELPLPDSAVARAVMVIDAAWANLKRAMSQSNIVVVLYEDLVGSPNEMAALLGDALHLGPTTRPVVAAPEIIERARQLTREELGGIPRVLYEIYDEVKATRALRP